MKSLFFVAAILVAAPALMEAEKSDVSDSGSWVTKEKKVCVSTFGEIVFVLDSSTSIGPEKWKEVVKFVEDVVIRVNRRALKAKGGVQVGVVVYNNFAKVVIPLGSEKDAKKLRQKIRKIKFTEGVTNTGAGLQLAQQEFDRMGAKNVSRTVILITDGASNFGPNSIVAANDIKAKGVTIMSVGVTDQIRKSELVDIASDDSFIHVHEFKDLPKFVSKIAVKVCETLQTKHCKAVADVALVLDLSRSIKSKNVALFREFLLKWSSKLAIGQGVRVSIFTFGKTARTELRLSQGVTQRAVRRALKTMKKQKGSNGGAGMEAAWREFKSHGRRKAAKLVVLISDARWNSGSGKRPFVAANAMRKMGVQIIAIGVTKKPKMKYLKRITEAKNRFVGIDYAELDALLPSLLHKTCHMISYPPPKPKPPGKFCFGPKIQNQPCEGKKPGMRTIEVGVPLGKKCFRLKIRHSILCGVTKCPPLPDFKTRCALGFKITGKQRFVLKDGKCLPEVTKLTVVECKDETKPKPPKTCGKPQTKVKHCKGKGTYGLLTTKFFLLLNGKCRKLMHQVKILCPKKKEKCPNDVSKVFPCVGGLKLTFVDRFKVQNGVCMAATTVLVQRCKQKPPKSCGKQKVSVGKCRSNGKASFSLVIPFRFFGKCMRVHFRGSALCRKKGCPKIVRKKSTKCLKALRGRYRLEFVYRYVSKKNMCVPSVRFQIKKCKRRSSKCGKRKVSIGKCGSNGKARFSLVVPTRFLGRCLRVHFRGTAVCRKKGQRCSKKVKRKTSSKCFVGGRYRLEFVYRYVSRRNMCVPYVRFRIRRCKRTPKPTGRCPSTKVRVLKPCRKRFGKSLVVMKLRIRGRCYAFKWKLKTYCKRPNESLVIRCEKFNKQRAFKMCSTIGKKVILKVNHVFMNNKCKPYVSYSIKSCKK